MVFTLLLSHYGKGMLSTAAVFIGMIFGYIICIPLNMVDLTPVAGAAWIAIPSVLRYGIKFDLASTLSMIHLGDRELLIISVAFALGIGVTVKPEILNSLPETLKMILSSGISTGTLAALILNVVLKDKREAI